MYGRGDERRRRSWRDRFWVVELQTQQNISTYTGLADALSALQILAVKNRSDHPSNPARFRTLSISYG